MNFKKITALLALVLMVMSVVACNEDDVKDIVEYNLTIQNNTTTAYDVWINNPLSNNGFYSAGHVAATQRTIIHELDIGIDYRVNLVNVGETAEPAVYTKIIKSNDKDVTWTVN